MIWVGGEGEGGGKGKGDGDVCSEQPLCDGAGA